MDISEVMKTIKGLQHTLQAMAAKQINSRLEFIITVFLF